jgi:hypothetical protein
MFGQLGRVFSQAFDNPYLEHLLGWFSKLQEHALVRWTPIALSNSPCNFRIGNPCNRPAISICAVCRTTTCLEHALVASNADVVCVGCANDLIKYVNQEREKPRAVPTPKPPQSVPPPTTDQLRKAHFKTMKLRPTATVEQVKARYKKLVMTAHPDRGGSAQEFSRITEAYNWITKVHFGQ